MKRIKMLILVLLVLALTAGVIAVRQKHRSAEVMHSGAAFVCAGSGIHYAF